MSASNFLQQLQSLDWDDGRGQLCQRAAKQNNLKLSISDFLTGLKIFSWDAGRLVYAKAMINKIDLVTDVSHEVILTKGIRRFSWDIGRVSYAAIVLDKFTHAVSDEC